jgi:hypothetical protein
MKGVSFDRWEKKYNNTVTGESWEYPEFKGFHSNMYRADLQTEMGVLKMVFASENLFLRLLLLISPFTGITTIRLACSPTDNCLF